MSKKAFLIREYKKNVTLGHLLIMKGSEVIHQLKTVELPWLNNQVEKSCIPEGKYKVVRRLGSESAKFKYTHFHVLDVPGRSWILFHVGNYTRDLLGCIAPGLIHADIDRDGITDVTNSSVALNLMLSEFENEFELVITS